MALAGQVEGIPETPFASNSELAMADSLFQTDLYLIYQWDAAELGLTINYQKDETYHQVWEGLPETMKGYLGKIGCGMERFTAMIKEAAREASEAGTPQVFRLKTNSPEALKWKGLAKQ